MSATNAEIVSFSGHDVNSPILKEYIMQTKEAALNARRKMGDYLTDENGSETPDSIGDDKGNKPQKENHLTLCFY